MKKYKFTINGNQYEADILSVEDNIAEIEINGSHYRVEVEKSIQSTKTPKLLRSSAVPSTDTHPSMAKTSIPSSARGGGNIKAPLPGVILDVHVKEGDHIKFGQKLITLEAMKMENRIDSDKEGRVVSLKVSKGDSVMEGDILITIGE